MPTLTPLDPISQEHTPSTELAEFKAALEKAIEKNASVIENTHFTLHGIAQLLDISKDLWEFYRYHAQGVKLTSEQLETLKREINTLSTHINQTLENLNDQKTKAQELLQETTTKLTQAQQLATQSQADMQTARQALETIKTLETKLPEIETQLESINSAISNAIDKKQELEDRASELKIEISTALTEKKSELETQLTEKKQELETELESIKADTQAIKAQTQELATQTASKAQQLNTKATELATKQEQIEQVQTQAQAQLESITQAAQATTTELAEAKEQATRGIESYKAGFLSDISIEFAKMMEHFTPTSAIALSALSARVGLLEKGLFEYEMLSQITSHFYTIQDMVYADQSCEELEIPQGCSRAYIVAYGGAEQVSVRSDTGAENTENSVFLIDTGFTNLVIVGGLQGEDIVAQAGELKAQQCYFQGESNLEINVDAVGGFVLVLFFTNRVPSESDDPFFSIHTEQFGLESSGLQAYLAHLDSLGGGDTLQSQALDQLTQATSLATQQSLSAFKNADFTNLKSFYTARLEYENTRKQIARQNGLQVPEPIDTQPYLDNAIDRGMLAYYIYLHNRRSDNELITRTFPLVLEQIAKMMDTHHASTAIAQSFSADDLQSLSSYFDSLGPLYRGGFTTEQERRTNLGFYLTYMAHSQAQTPREPADQMGWILGEIYRHLGRPNLADTLKYTQMTKILRQEIPSEKSVATLKEYIKATIDKDVQAQAEQRASACVRGLQDTHAQGIFSVLTMIKNALIMDSGEESSPPPPNPLEPYEPQSLENDGNEAFLA